jgi:hypothetical protein
LIALWCSAALAGAWTRDAGSLYSKAGVDVYSALRFVAPGEGDQVSEGEYFAHQYSVYGEAGLLPGKRLQLQLQVPAIVGIHSTELVDALRVIPLRATTARLGDATFGLQAALHPRIPLSAALLVKVPLYANGGVGDAYPTFAEVFPKPGDGQVDFTAWVFAGSGLPTGLGSGFLEAGVGYRHRTELFVGWSDAPEDLTFVDGFVFTAKVGRSFGKVLPIVGVDGVLSFVPDDWTREFVSVYGAALIDLGKGVAIEPRFAGEVLARRASQGIGGGLGVSYRR